MRGKHGAPRILCSARHTAKYDETCLPRGVGKLVRQAKERRRNSFARRKKKRRGGGAGGKGTRLARNGEGRNVEGETEVKGRAARLEARSEARAAATSKSVAARALAQISRLLHAGSRGERNAALRKSTVQKCGVHACACDVRRSRNTYSRVSRKTPPDSNCARVFLREREGNCEG